MDAFISKKSFAISSQLVINGTLSDKIDLEYGFPQGSKIGPFGFKLYTKFLAAIAKKHKVHLHLYADDTQLYLPFDPQNSKFATKQIEACIAEIKSWMGSNFLKLNDEKTEFILFGSEHDLKAIIINKSQAQNLIAVHPSQTQNQVFVPPLSRPKPRIQ